jgi:integral membrane sensor domain MASE1
MKKAREPTYSFVILTLVLIAINTILARLSVITLPLALPSGASGVSVIYFAVAFMILLTLWFGMYGAISAYVGTLIGSGLLNPAIPPAVAVYWSIAGLLQVLIPLIAFRSLDVDLRLENRRDGTILILFGVLINNIIGAIWGTYTLALGGVIMPSDTISVFSAWLLGNILVTIIIVPIVLSRVSGRIRRSKLFVKGYWV